MLLIHPRKNGGYGMMSLKEVAKANTISIFTKMAENNPNIQQIIKSHLKKKG